MGDCAWAGMEAGKSWFSMLFDHIGTFEDLHCLIWSSVISVHSGCGIHCLMWTSAVGLRGSLWRHAYFQYAQSLLVHWFSTSHLWGTVTKASHLPPLPHCRVENSGVLPVQIYTTVTFSLGFCLLQLNLDATKFSGVLSPVLGLA